MNVKSRLKKFVESQKITVTDFEKSIGVSNGYVNSISKNIGIDKICMLLENYPNVNLEWLFTGNGEMFKNGIVEMPEVKFVDTNFLLDRIEKLAVRNNELEKELELLKNTPKRNINSKPYTQGDGKLMLVAEKRNK